MSSEQIFIIHSDGTIADLLEHSILRPAGYDVTQIRDRKALDLLLQTNHPHLVILGDRIPEGSGLDLAVQLLESRPDTAIVLASDPFSDGLLLRAIHSGLSGYLYPPFETGEVLEVIQGVLERQRRLKQWSLRHKEDNTSALQQKVESMEALQRIGRKVTSILELDSVLTAVVDAAVELTGAEEGSLLLMDETTGELYMRAARNFREDFVRTFRVPIKDTLPGEVLRTGQPLLLNTATPKKIKTSYLVHTLMYVPIQVSDRVIGVLGVDNRRSGHPFSDYHLDVVYALADYAAIAVENARLFASSQVEREKLETLLTQVQDGVVVLDEDARIMLLNQSAQAAFGLEGRDLVGRQVQDVIQHPDLLEILNGQKDSTPYRGEITLADGRVLSAQVTPISGVGLAVIMQDITYLKELDRIKSDFVSTVSHDLRSPLTAILGYVELLGRVGELNSQQEGFIQRIQVSVENITSLINDLLDLGRIESGFDARKEIVPLAAIIRYTIESMRSQAEEKGQNLVLDIPEGLPHILGNPVRLRQMLENLVANAINYTPKDGEIRVTTRSESEQVIIAVSDTGPGIPHADQPYIFDKFYRASNIPPDTPGAGLGLAIVRSIVENHQGRIWVSSTPGQGSTFTIVLPTTDNFFSQTQVS